jgi:hypothetical protein
MQHNRTFHDMTFTALSKRADEVETLDTVADILGGDDLREVTVFLSHERDEWYRGGEWHERLTSKEVIGVALADLDDPQAAIEILTREQACDLFGLKFIQYRECI